MAKIISSITIVMALAMRPGRRPFVPETMRVLSANKLSLLTMRKIL